MLRDVRNKDENGQNLLYYPQKKEELQQKFAKLAQQITIYLWLWLHFHFYMNLTIMSKLTFQ